MIEANVIRAALADLEATRADLDAQRDKLTAAIDALRPLVPLAPDQRVSPEAPPPMVPPTSEVAPIVDAGDLSTQLLALLGTGVSSPKDLTARSQADKVAVRTALKGLLQRGLVYAEGTTLSRRYHLVQRKGKKGDRTPATRTEEP